MVDSRENYKIDLGVKGLTNSPCQHPSKSIESSMDNNYAYWFQGVNVMS